MVNTYSSLTGFAMFAQAYLSEYLGQYGKHLQQSDWVCTVCSGLSVQISRAVWYILTVIYE